AQIIVTDGDFTDWSVVAFGSGGSVSASRQASGGNPGADIKITTQGSSGLIGASGVKNDFSTSGMPFANAPFTFSLDVSNGPGSFGNEQQIDLLFAQNGAIYDNVSFNGTMSRRASLS